jgi:hypothetical protein
MRTGRRLLVMPAVVLALAGCGADPRADSADSVAEGSTAAVSSAASDGVEVQRHPDIVEADVMAAGDETFDIAVTVSSPYDTPGRYADGWRVLAPDGMQLATHTLMHDHAGEQPFTRTQSGVEIPADVAEVTIEGRDQRYGFGGATVTVAVPHGDG